MLLGIYDDLLLGGGAVAAALQGGYRLILSGFALNPAAAPAIVGTRDLANWTAGSAPWAGSVLSVAQGNELMLATGFSADGGHPQGQNHLARSKDYGATWTELTMPGNGLDTNFGGWQVAFGRGLFVGVGNQLGNAIGTDGLSTSPDGVTWTPRAIPWYGPARAAFVNDLFVMVGYDAVAVSPALATSVDGVSWAKRPTIWGTMQNGILSISYENGYWIVTRSGMDGSGNYAYSTDLANWTLGAAPSNGPGYLNQIVYFAGNYYASSYTTSSASGYPVATGRTLSVSPDLKTWRVLATGLPGIGPIGLLNVDGARMMLLNHETNGQYMVSAGGFSYNTPGPVTSYYVTTDMQSFNPLSVPASFWQASLVGTIGRW